MFTKTYRNKFEIKEQLSQVLKLRVTTKRPTRGFTAVTLILYKTQIRQKSNIK